MAESLGSVYAELRLKLDALDKDLRDAEKKLGGIGTSTSSTLTSKLDSVSSTLTTKGKTLTKTVTLPIVGAFTAAIAAGMSFEDQMGRVAAISGEIGKPLEELNDLARELGATTRYTATEAAQGMEELAAAGFNASEIMDALPGLLSLASSGAIDLASASDIASSTLRGFGLDAGEANHVADVLAESAARTNAQVEDLGEGMKYVAPIAAAMGLSLEETAAAMGILSNAGIKGSMSGTALRGALTRIAKPTAQVKDVMDELGITFYDNEGKMFSLSKIVGILQDKTKDLTQQEKNHAITTIFGQSAMSGMLTLMEAGPDVLEDMTTAYENSDGAAKKMSDTMENTTAGALRELKSAGEGLLIEFFNQMGPAIGDVIDDLTKFIRKLSEMDDSTKETILKFLLLAATVGPLLLAFGKIVGAVSGVIKIFTALKGAIAVVKTAISAQGLAGALASLIGPQGLIVLAGVAIAGLSAYAYSLGEDIREANKEFDEFFDTLERSKEDYKIKMGDIELQRDQLSGLVDELYDLESKTNKTAGEQARMSAIVGELNERMPELNLSIDEQSGLLNKTEEATYDLIEAMWEEQKAAGMRERLIEIMDEQYEAQKKLAEAQERFAKAEEAYQEVAGKFRVTFGKDLIWDEYVAATQYLKETEDAVSGLTTEYATLQEEHDSFVAKFKENNQQVSDDSLETAVGVADALELQGDEYEKFFTDLETRAEEHLQAMGDIEAERIEQSELTADQVRANLEQQIKDFENWRSEIQSLSARVPPEVLYELQKLGPQYTLLIQDLNNMTDEELEEWISIWGAKSALASEAAIAEQEELNKSMNEYGKSHGSQYAAGVDESHALVYSSTNAAAKEANRGMVEGLIDLWKLGYDKLSEYNAGVEANKPNAYSSMFTAGEQTGKGFVDGVDSKNESAWSAGLRIARSALNAMRYSLGIHSPSDETFFAGDMFGEGYVEGILAKIRNAKLAAAALAESGMAGLSPYLDMFSNNQHLQLETSAGQQLVQHQHHVSGAIDVKGYTDKGEYLGKHREVIDQLNFESLLDYRKV